MSISQSASAAPAADIATVDQVQALLLDLIKSNRQETDFVRTQGTHYRGQLANGNYGADKLKDRANLLELTTRFRIAADLLDQVTEQLRTTVTDPLELRTTLELAACIEQA